MLWFDISLDPPVIRYRNAANDEWEVLFDFLAALEAAGAMRYEEG